MNAFVNGAREGQQQNPAVGSSCSNGTDTGVQKSFYVLIYKELTFINDYKFVSIDRKMIFLNFCRFYDIINIFGILIKKCPKCANIF